MNSAARRGPSTRWAACERAWAVALLLVAACDGEVVVSDPSPRVLSSAVAANFNNVLSAVVTAQVADAGSVAVRYGLEGGPLDSVTPEVVSADEAVLLPVLGLLPDTAYSLQVIAYGFGGPSEGERLAFETGPLPADLPRFNAGGPDPSPGFVAFAAGAYGLVIDNEGRVVWYRRFENGVGLNFQVQPTGRYFAQPPTPDPGDLEPWLEIDVLGNVVRSVNCAGGLRSRFHDLIAEAGGTYWLMCDEARTMDLSAYGGLAEARVTGTAIQRVDASGALLFQWSPFDHFAITDLNPAALTVPNVNWTHGNALDFDTDGHLLVSFRSLNEITKIDRESGGVLWRMGGLRNGFDFLDTATPGFVWQHGLRVTGPGGFMLLDNLGDPEGTSAERYLWDAELGAVRLVESYGSTPPVTARLGGTTQHLPGERALVAFGDGRRVEEYDASGESVWRIEGDPGYVFRAQRISSLYHPGLGLRR